MFVVLAVQQPACRKMPGCTFGPDQADHTAVQQRRTASSGKALRWPTQPTFLLFTDNATISSTSHSDEQTCTYKQVQTMDALCVCAIKLAFKRWLCLAPLCPYIYSHSRNRRTRLWRHFSNMCYGSDPQLRKGKSGSFNPLPRLKKLDFSFLRPFRNQSWR